MLKFNKKGESYVETVVGVVACMMVIVTALNIFSFLTLKQDLDYFGKEMMESATVHGRTNTEVTKRFTELCKETGLNPAYSFEGTEYFNSSKGTVQLGEVIHLSLSMRTDVKGLGVFKIPVTLKVSLSGLSERYWK